jgi:regulator of replication initiation timing
MSSSPPFRGNLEQKIRNLQDENKKLAEKLEKMRDVNAEMMIYNQHLKSRLHAAENPHLRKKLPDVWSWVGCGGDD